jgi:hypothetical protein
MCMSGNAHISQNQHRVRRGGKYVAYQSPHASEAGHAPAAEVLKEARGGCEGTAPAEATFDVSNGPAVEGQSASEFSRYESNWQAPTRRIRSRMKGSESVMCMCRRGESPKPRDDEESDARV